MCDYSLMCFPNRLANEGEDLVVHRFPSGSMGLASPNDLRPPDGDGQRRSFWQAVKEFFNPVDTCAVPAVCIPPAARLQLHGIGDDFRREYSVSSDEEVTFEELSASVNTYRDAVRFQNGRQVRIQELPEGLEVTVLSLAAESTATPELDGVEELSGYAYPPAPLR